jgi:tetratricopeptide (TPR) repeat protein
VFIARIDLLTRIELFLRRHDLTPLAVAEAAHYSRQHVLRVRSGDVSPTRRFVIDMTAACETLTRESVTAGMLFERGDLLLASSYQRLSRLFADDLRLLDALLADVSGDDWPARAVRGIAGSETAVRHLLRAGEPIIDRAPRQSAAVYYAAMQIAAALAETPAELAASLQAHALKGRANALRHLGDFDAALADLSLAARLFAKARYCVDEIGQAEYTRGTVLFKMQRWSEAEAAARQARARFVAVDDTRRAAHADILRAGILFDQGEIDAARDIWFRLMSILDELGDDDALARVWQNLGACEIRRGHAADARRWLVYAAAKFRELGNHSELARTRWNIATYVATFGDPRRGIRLLRYVEKEFVELHAFADAGCVGLEIVERMLGAGSSDTALTRRAQEVAGVLVQAGLDVSAADALDQLRRIARARSRSAVLAHVRAALRDLDIPCRQGGDDALGAADAPRPLS